ncbi:hypothetical protein PR202_gb06127 [Eleusine coracana subsp. coracana]|uniref:Titin-like n=1 Tax=Eleusine coracana subsp. coracana TaxID=191504 RepID=A0AAV5E8R5_ELECO|nr:hypothetical protein PR202_gb06127 [Eleusine coracana subsp. coracana]
MQTRLDSKLSSMEIKNVAETIDSTEGTLKIPEDQVLVDAPSEIKLPLEHNPNGTSSSLNGHMDEENKISNEQLQGDNTVDGSTKTDEVALQETVPFISIIERGFQKILILINTQKWWSKKINRVNKLVPRNADAVQEDIPKCEESGVSKEMPKSEHADESTTDAQEVLHQEPSEDTNGLAYEKREQTSQQSSMAASDDTTSEPPVDIQVQNKKSLEEMKDADAVDTEAAMQEKYIAFEEATTPEYHVATTEQDSVETNNTEITNVATVDEANKEKNMPGIESEVTKSTEPVETEEDSDQRYFSLLDNSAQGDDMPASVSEEPSPQDYVTESEATSDSKEVNTTESSEKTREILDQNSMNSAGKSTQENNAPESELISQIQPEELESEEMKVNELVQVNESSPEISATVFHKEIQENNPATSELHVMESGGMRNIETTEVQVTPHQLNCDHPEEKTTEETITSSEPQTLEPESVKKMNDIEASKPQDISQQSIISPSEKSVPEEIAKEDIVTIESNDGHQQPKDPESAELDEIKTNKSQEIASSSIVFNYEEPTSQDDVTVTEPNSETQAENLLSAEVMEDTENVKGHGALSGEVAKEENVETETIADMSPVQEPELEEAKNTEPVGTEDNITPTELPAERMEKETVEIEAIPYESRVASIRDVAENDILTAITSHADIQPVLKQESVEDKCIDTTEKPRETQQIVSSPSDELIPAENKMAMTEPACETPLQNVIAQGIKDCEDAPTDQISNLDSFPTTGEADQENKLPGFEPTSDDQELGSTEQTIGIEAMETEDHQQHRVSTLEETAVNKKPNVDDHQVHEEKLDNEAMEDEPVFEQTTEGIVQDEINPPAGMEKEHEPKSLETSDVQEVQELGSIEQTRGVEATEIEDHQQYIVSTLDEPEVDKKPNVDDHQVHEEKPAELIDNGAMEAEPVLEQSNISTTDNPPEERSERGTDPYCCVQPAQQVESSKDSEESNRLNEEETSDQEIITLEDTTTEDIVQDEINPPADMEQEHEPKSLETSDVQEVQELDSIEETRGVEATEIKDHQQHRVSTLEESAVDKPNVDDHQVHEEKPAELKDNEAMEAEPVLEQSNISTPDNAPAQQKHERKSLETSDVQEVQDLGSIEQTRGTEATETEDHQQHRVSTLEEPAVDKKPNVDDHQVHDEKPAELKDNEAMEAEPVLEQSNISTSDNAPEERSELGTDPDCCVHPAQQVESSRDSEDSKLLKEEETSDQKIITLEDTGTVGIVEDEFDPPVSMEQEHEQKSVEEVKDINANEAKEDFHTNQPDALDKLASESNTATAEPTYDIQHLDDFETKETKSIEGIDDGDISCQQAGVATSVDPSPTDNEIAPQEHPVESHEENLGNETENEMLDRGMKEEIHRSAEPKDDAFHLGETIPTTKKSKNLADEDVIQSSGEDTLESSNDKDINRESVTERGTTEISQALIGNDAQASQECYRGRWNNEKWLDNPYVHQRTPPQALQIPQSKTSQERKKGLKTKIGLTVPTPQTLMLKWRNKKTRRIQGKDNIVPMDSTRGQDETTDEITNEELEPSLASCVQDISHTSPSKDHILENDPTAVPYNVGSGGHEDKECTNKVNDDLPAIQELEKEIVTGMQENKEMQNETKGAHHVESHTKAEVEDMFQLHSNEPYNVDTKIDDTVHNTTVQPRETEEIGENKGFSSIYKPVVETSEQNNVEQDLSIQHKVEDEKLESIEDNAAEMEATQQKVDTSNVDTSNDDQLSTSNALTKHETESADDVLQLETEGNTFDKANETVLCEKTEASNTSVPETVTFNEEICDKVTEVEGGLSDESLKTFDDTRRNLDVSSVVTESNEESMNEDMEEHKLAAPEHPTMDENTPKQQISVSEKPLPIEPEEQDDQIHKKQDEKDMREPDFGDDQKEVEQDLPVSNFLMNLILGKENSDANGHSEPEAETKQEETRDDNSCSIIPKQEKRLVLPTTENNMEGKLTVEQEQKDVKCSEEKYEVVEEQSHDLKMGTETSLETDAEFNKNSHHLELPSYQDKMQDGISNEILSEEPAEAFAKIEAKDLAIPSIIHDDREIDTVCQENTEAATQNQIRSLKNNLDDFKNTKISEEDTPGEGETGLLPECLNEARSVNSVSEQTLLLTDSGMTDAKSLPSPDPVCEIQDKIIESSSIGAISIPDIQVESEEDKTEKKQPTITATGDVAEEHVEISNDNPQKSIGPETTSNEQEPQIAQQVNDTEIILGHEKDILADVREPEQSFVDTANPECSTDEEQSPKADESNISEQKTYEGKTKDEEKIKSFTDEEIKTEAHVTGEKAVHKKQNLLSGVGSKHRVLSKSIPRPHCEVRNPPPGHCRARAAQCSASSAEQVAGMGARRAGGSWRRFLHVLPARLNRLHDALRVDGRLPRSSHYRDCQRGDGGCLPRSSQSARHRSDAALQRRAARRKPMSSNHIATAY